MQVILPITVDVALCIKGYPANKDQPYLVYRATLPTKRLFPDVEADPANIIFPDWNQLKQDRI